MCIGMNMFIKIFKVLQNVRLRFLLVYYIDKNTFFKLQ